jgi:hypothetical protein
MTYFIDCNVGIKKCFPQCLGEYGNKNLEDYLSVFSEFLRDTPTV